MKNLEKEIIEELGTKMQSEIDREILWGMLVGLGWTRVMISRFIDNRHAIDITDWLEHNCKNAFERSGKDFIFEQETDAVNFILKWK